MADRSERERSPERTLPPADGQDLSLPPGPGPAVARRSPATVASNGRRADPDDVRREIEATRDRISGTLDRLELRLVHEKEELARKKEALWAKATFRGVRRKIAEEPFRSMAIAFAAGYIIAAIRD